MGPKLAPVEEFYQQKPALKVSPDSPVASIRTGGELLPDGHSISLIWDSRTDRLKLLFANGNTEVIDSAIEYSGRTFLPPDLSESLQSAIVFPEEVKDFGSTAILFMAIKESLMNFGLLEQAALAAVCFVLSSWFAEVLPAAPFMLISGPRPEATLLLALLGCLVRHPLLLVDISPASMRTLPMNLHSTLLIDNELVRDSLLRLLSVSNNRNAHVAVRNGVVNTCSAKALYCGPDEREDPFGDATMHVNLSPSDGVLPILTQKDRQDLAARFQPALLAYRVRNIASVHEAHVSFPGLPRQARVLASVLAGCLVDAPELQASIGSLFENQQDRFRTERWLDPRCVVIEAILSRCHRKEEEGDTVHVGEIAMDASAILKGRGEVVALEPRAIGAILRGLGLIAKRSSQGYQLQLNDSLCRRIHKLARQFEVAAVQEGKKMCSHCIEGDAARDNTV